MKLIAIHEFSCFPDGEHEMKVTAGSTFEIEDPEYAGLLISKGHAKEQGGGAAAPIKEAPALSRATGKNKGDV